jgi:prepilin-type N-terminal cleavage/methylation domain-containing protein
MLKNNKGFSLIELVIVIAIMALLAGLSTMTFNSVISARSERMMDNFKTYTQYAKTLTKAESRDICMALMKGTNDHYYVVYGTASGDASTFQSLNTSTQTDAVTGEKKLVYNPGYSLSQLANDPSQAAEYKDLGNYITVFYEGNEVTSGAGNAVIVKFLKFDGSVVWGSGKFSFSKYRSKDIKCSTTLNESTGAFLDESKASASASGNATN